MPAATAHYLAITRPLLHYAIYALKTAKPGEIFWFITMRHELERKPSIASMPQNQRWEIVEYLKQGFQ